MSLGCNEFSKEPSTRNTSRCSLWEASFPLGEDCGVAAAVAWVFSLPLSWFFCLPAFQEPQGGGSYGRGADTWEALSSRTLVVLPLR